MRRRLFTDYSDAVKGAIDAGVSFALCKGFDSTVPRWFCDPGSGVPASSDTFFAVPWLGKWGNRHVVRDVLSASQAAALQPRLHDWSGCCIPVSEDTDRNAYIEAVTTIISDLKKRGGKTVISQVITDSESINDIAATALPYLDSAPLNTFRCLFYTPHTGCWLVASPEVLAVYDASCCALRTMSLAGTRRAGTPGAWDAKNKAEQQMVTDFIADCLTRHGSTPHIGRQHTRTAVGVEHLCTRLTAQGIAAENLPALLDDLCPTPALCGFPRPEAIARISAAEKHPRRMYGGYIGFASPACVVTAVMLRCAQLAPQGRCIYGGGGITAMSDAEAEWAEGRLKARPLIQLFKNAKQSKPV